MSRREAAERRASFKTASDLPRDAVYGPEDVADPDAIGEPGEYPVHPRPAPRRLPRALWTMRQYAGFGTAAESNRRYRYLLERGTTGLSVAFDLPTQIGYDSDDPHAAGEVGRVGVAIDSLEDMEVLLDGIPLDRVSTSMTINATAAILLALYVAVARRRGIAEDALSGTVQNDILKEYVARGTYIYPPGAVAAARHRRVRLLRGARAEVEHHLHLRLPHPRGGGDGAAGDRLHVRARARVRARRARGRPRPRALRRARLVLLRLPLRLRRGGGEVPRRAAAVGAARQGDASASTTRRRSSCASTCRRAG